MVEEFGIRSYVTEVLILPTSPLVGKPLAAPAWGHELDLTVLRIMRDESQHLLPRGNMILRAGDVLLVEGPRTEVLKVKDTTGIEIKPDVELSDPNLRGEDTALVEALVVPGSNLVGHTLRGLRFRERHGLQVLGINREGRNLLRRLSRLSLRVGDVLLVQGPKANLAAVEDERGFSILNAVEEKRTDRRRASLTTAIFAASVLLAASNLVPVSVAMLLGAFVTFLTRCITPTDAYREVEWRLIILVGCMLGLGGAMSHTGAAAYLAARLVDVGSAWGPVWLLGGFFLLTALLTQIMSNQGAAVVLLPIAIHTATQLGFNPRAFAVVITVAASCSFLTPLEPACLLVYGPGRYRFSDFLKVGTPLTLLVLAVALLLVPWFWPLRPAG
jgi:di/tricarboxylate transporter